MSETSASVRTDNPVIQQPKKKHRWYFYLGIVILALAIATAGFLGFLTVTEYRPEPIEAAESGPISTLLEYDGQPLRILSFNTGYGGLGSEADFLLDGGTSAGPKDKPTVEKNMQGIEGILHDADADILMLQEVDKNSQRTYHQNQWKRYAETLGAYEVYYAPNYVCHFVPYPLKAPIGSIHSGIATYSRYSVSDAVRQSLPVPFSWPLRTANLKRCLLVSRIPVKDSGKELVIVNLHLEAYDDGEGKIAQTQQLLSLLQDEYAKGNYVIAGGDFNQVFPNAKNEIKETSEWVPGVLEPLPEGWTYAFDDSTPTCRLLNQPYDPSSPLTQYYMLDGFIISPNIEVLDVTTINQDFAFSDHNPVALDFALQ